MLRAIEDATDILPVLSFQAITVPILRTDVADNSRIMAFGNSLYERLVAEVE
jgi:hypothetical protein